MLSRAGQGGAARGVPETAPAGVAGHARGATPGGWGNYSLFLTEDGLLVGYLETPDYQAALDRMAGTEVNSRWQEEIAPYFTELDGLPPDRGFKRVAEIFHLD